MSFLIRFDFLTEIDDEWTELISCVWQRRKVKYVCMDDTLIVIYFIICDAKMHKKIVYARTSNGWDKRTPMNIQVEKYSAQCNDWVHTGMQIAGRDRIGQLLKFSILEWNFHIFFLFNSPKAFITNRMLQC